MKTIRLKNENVENVEVVCPDPTPQRHSNKFNDEISKKSASEKRASALAFAADAFFIFQQLNLLQCLGAFFPPAPPSDERVDISPI